MLRPTAIKGHGNLPLVQPQDELPSYIRKYSSTLIALITYKMRSFVLLHFFLNRLLYSLTATFGIFGVIVSPRLKSIHDVRCKYPISDSEYI